MSHLVRGALALGVIYLLTLASTDPVDLLMGVVAGGILIGLTAPRLQHAPRGEVPPFAQRLLWFPVFAAGVLADIAKGTVDVALRVLHLRDVERPGIVRVPIEGRTERGVAVSALATTLSPGAVLIEVDWDRREMLLHVIDATDPDGVRAKMQAFYDRYQRRVFP